MKLCTVLFALLISTPAIAKTKPLMPGPFVFAGTVFEQEEGNEVFEGIVRLAGCSASLVKFKGQSTQSFAMVMTNDHCLDDQAYLTYTLNRPYSKSVQIYNKHKQFIGKTFTSTRLIYATQTDTDVGLLELPITYDELEKLYDVRPLELSEKIASVGDQALVITGYFGRAIQCDIAAFVYKLVEDSWTWKNSYRYAPCATGHGTSGSPIVLKGTREVVGINNTGNDHGQKCTLNNPCEVDENGVITVRQGQNYGQQINGLYTCLNANFEIDLTLPSCTMFGGAGWKAE